MQADGVEAVSTADAVTGSVNNGVTTIDVTSSVEAWLNGAANYGWAFLSLGSDGWRFSSSEGGTPPKLDIVYTIESGTPANTPPVAHDDNATFNEDTTLAVAVLGNDTDANGDPLYVTGIDTGPAHGTAAVNADDTIRTRRTPISSARTASPTPSATGMAALPRRPLALPSIRSMTCLWPRTMWPIRDEPERDSRRAA